MLLIALLLWIGMSRPAAAQNTTDAPPRDPLALAQRLNGYEQPFAFPEITPTYSVGDEAEFWVPRTGADAPVRVTATLAGAAAAAYVWVEDGIDAGANADEVNALAQQYSAIFQQLRLRSVYGSEQIQLEAGEAPLPEDLVTIPNVDDDEHIHVLYTRDVRDERTAFYSPINSTTAALLPGGYSNQRELIYVDTGPFAEVPITDAVYINATMQAYLSLVMRAHNPAQAPWLQAVLIDFTMRQLQQADAPAADILAYLDEPLTGLTGTGNYATRQRYAGVQYLFLAYLFQRYGADALRGLFSAPGEGMAAVDHVLAQIAATDPVTIEPVSARALFADFVLTNVLNLPFGDGRYVHTAVTLPQGASASTTPLAGFGDTTLADRRVEQFAPYYLILGNDTEDDASLAVSFEGQPSTPRLPMPADRDPSDRFYWSGRAQDANPRMTRAVDLRAAITATLTFDGWYAQPYDINYAYVSVSADDGATWALLPVTPSTAADPYGAAYGSGITGYSSPEGARPFPVLGIVIGELTEISIPDSNQTQIGITVGGVSNNGPAAAAGVQTGDIIVGYDGVRWQRVPNLIAVLEDYAPADTITLMIQREGAMLNIPVVADAHPTRRILPAPLWLRHEADLSAYAGQEILLRFETVTLPGYFTEGFAIDNIEIPQVNFGDGGEQADEWMLEGFTSTTNEVPQQYIVQTVTLVPAQTQQGQVVLVPQSVAQVIPPGDATTSQVWRLVMPRGQALIIAISPVNDDTFQPARFDLTLDVQEGQGA
jgi:hypothetical protein